MTDPFVIILIGATFLVAGIVKGVVGLGLPTVSLALLTATLGLQPAMALLLAPSFVTNLWQALIGGHGRAILARTWPFLLAATVTIWVGAQALTRVDVALLSALLGMVLVVYAAAGLTGPQLAVPRPWEVWAGPLVGTANGLLTGMTGSFVVPGVMYLQAIGLPRDMLVQAMGMLFAASTVGLAVALGGQQLLTAELGALSVAAILPAVIGMALGQRLRRRVPEARFRKLLLAALAALGLFIIAKAAM
ncbi:MAG TPA: sulfite exporter TauE/SafE family protein [Afifellaceae bacterium]|nr:sulfite exporter TauE/SafE family protein [Afifellaceae bacterium]